MKQLDSYIIEKLHLNKNINTSPVDFKKGEPIIRIGIFSYNGRTIDELEINDPVRSIIYYYYDTQDNGEIRFTYTPNDRDDIDRYSYERDMFINSNGYYEFLGSIGSDQDKWTAKIIYLNKEEGINFIKDIALDFYHQKNKIYQYFDKSDSFDSVAIKNSPDKVKDLLDLYEKL